jgi:hypothetical protein
MIACGMVEDIQAVENANPGFTNIILTGGKDSQNLLLLPWSNPTIVASGPPNHELVEQFLAQNHITYELIELEDRDDSVRDEDVLINCCRSNLAHLRWSAHLRQLAADRQHRVIFWAGQLGDTFCTPYWRTYRVHGEGRRAPKSRLHRRLARYTSWLTAPMHHAFERAGVTQSKFFDALWRRGAMWQGTNMGIRREMTGCLWLSGYHGKAVERAKGLLQEHEQLSEPAAFRWLQKTAMERRLTMKAVAQQVIERYVGS